LGLYPDVGLNFFVKRPPFFPWIDPQKFREIYIYGNILKSAEKKNNENDSNV